MCKSKHFHPQWREFAVILCESLFWMCLLPGRRKAQNSDLCRNAISTLSKGNSCLSALKVSECSNHAPVLRCSNAAYSQSERRQSQGSELSTGTTGHLLYVVDPLGSGAFNSFYVSCGPLMCLYPCYLRTTGARGH